MLLQLIVKTSLISGFLKFVYALKRKVKHVFNDLLYAIDCCFQLKT